MHFNRLAVATAMVALAAFATDADAKTAGTAYRSKTNPAVCTNPAVLTLPVRITQSTHISVSARATFSASYVLEEMGGIYVDLVETSSGTRVIAASQRAYALVNPSLKTLIRSDGLLHEGTRFMDPTAQILTAAPGNYTLRMHVFAHANFGVLVPWTCDSAANPRFDDLTLSYTLLSPN